MSGKKNTMCFSHDPTKATYCSSPGTGFDHKADFLALQTCVQLYAHKEMKNKISGRGDYYCWEDKYVCCGIETLLRVNMHCKRGVYSGERDTCTAGGGGGGSDEGVCVYNAVIYTATQSCSFNALFGESDASVMHPLLLIWKGLPSYFDCAE